LTIIIPAYKETAEHLDRILTSFESQTFVPNYNVECIFIVDGIRDTYDYLNGKLQTCKRFTYKLHFNEENLGIGATRDKGINLAAGEYITFCDADDALANDKVIKSMSKYKRSGQDWVIGTSLEERPPNGVVKQSNPLKFSAWGRLFKRDFLIKHEINTGGLRHNEDNVLCFLLNLFCEKPMVDDDEWYVYKHNNVDSITRRQEKNQSGFLKDRLVVIEYFYRIIVGLLSKYPEKEQRIRRLVPCFTKPFVGYVEGVLNNVNHGENLCLF
jgi:glycosyltransferase involved in cell wall biosynthesis